MADIPLGPEVYANWKAYYNDNPIRTSYELSLFTDAHITGELSSGIGPFQLLNGAAFGEDHSLRPGIILRFDSIQLDDEYQNRQSKQTDNSRYHAGGLHDEIAALISLALGIRVEVGGVLREFVPKSDPRGRPRNLNDNPQPVLSRRYSGRRYIMPYALGEHSLNNINLINTFTSIPRMKPQSATALVVAARTYQNAMWVAEAAPELAWLMLVSAIETAAVHWDGAAEAPLDKLEASKPEIFSLLMNSGGPELAYKVAAQIAPSLGVTSKFIRFIMQFLPDAPTLCPPEYARFRWSKTNMRAALSQIYDYRSKALHEGRPFPLPMCESPGLLGNIEEGSGYAEVPSGIATYTFAASWQHEDTPMLLHTFEYIVRNVLLKWCISMISQP